MQVNHSPIGAVALNSTGWPIDREQTALLFGFQGPVLNTVDALFAVDPFASTAELLVGAVSILRRFLAELREWLRAEPDAFRLTDAWLDLGLDAVPLRFQPVVSLSRLLTSAHRLEAEAGAVAAAVWTAPYGPATTTVDRLLHPLLTLVVDVTRLTERIASLVAAMEVNRAYLANRAGRDHTTYGELADFLIAEEGLKPDAARTIAAIVVRRAQEQGIEASGVTPDLIDAAALLAIGRELGVEVESIGRYLAPRRVLERRTATGSPSPESTRAYLSLERSRLDDEQAWNSEAVSRLEQATAELGRLSRALLDTTR